MRRSSSTAVFAVQYVMVTRVGIEPARRVLRSIPACAGEPGTPCVWTGRPAVYPRVCGGTTLAECERRTGAGLSPRVRGNLLANRDATEEMGSIPACAGEPSRRFAVRRTVEVYPRVCGGTCPGSESFCSGIGLSPRVRGNPDLYATRWAQLGSIPACAGEPTPPRRWTWAPTVYPRVCGGTTIVLVSIYPDEGLSPRVRGNPNKRINPRSAERSIPACAGEPPTA